jgi:hypothetical protein
MAYITVINGVEYRKTTVDGVELYDPPLPSSETSKRKGKMAELLAARKFPGVATDTTFLSGFGSLEKQFQGDTQSLNETVSKARSLGYNPGVNDVYIPTMARFQGDPEAFLKAGEGRGKIRKLCEKRGTGCSGAVSVTAREPERDPLELAPKLHPKLVDEEVRRMVKRNPSNRRRNIREMREEVIAKHGRT